MDDEEVTQMTAGYAFPHATAGESRRLHLLAERLDPVTKRRIGQLGLADIGADAGLDIVLPGTTLAEFHRLSMAAMSQSLISAGLLTAAEADRLTARLAEPDFMGCGFAHIGAWGRRNDRSSA